MAWLGGRISQAHSSGEITWIVCIAPRKSVLGLNGCDCVTGTISVFSEVGFLPRGNLDRLHCTTQIGLGMKQLRVPHQLPQPLALFDFSLILSLAGWIEEGCLVEGWFSGARLFFGQWLVISGVCRQYELAFMFRLEPIVSLRSRRLAKLHSTK